MDGNKVIYLDVQDILDALDILEDDEVVIENEKTEDIENVKAKM